MFVSHIKTMLGALKPVEAQAHCDTADGPAVACGRKALETGNINHALKWIPAGGEAELRDVFVKTLAVRTLGIDAAEVADRLFLETLVRLHRASEGVAFTGIQPVGAPVGVVVAAADQAIALRSDAHLLSLVPQERRAELDRRFDFALAAKDFDVDDVVAGRRYLAAYVDFFTYAEGEDHAHHERANDHADAHDHACAH